MVNALEAPADELIRRVASYLKDRVPEVTPPSWAFLVKTGSYKNGLPEDPDWWYVRAASILRKLYKRRSPVGIERLRTAYGGRKRRGSAPDHFSKGSGSVISEILKQLEEAGLVEQAPKKGRRLTSKGVSLLDNIAHQVLKELAQTTPVLKKYLSK